MSEFTGKLSTLKRRVKVEEFLLFAKNDKTFNVTKKDCVRAFNIAKEEEVGLNDAIAWVVMTNNEVKEIYSFDKDFDKLKGIKRFTA
ncbi:MAG: PIN domain-containing protein [Candidatus Jordarchaeaceae archaeon]